MASGAPMVMARPTRNGNAPMASIVAPSAIEPIHSAKPAN